MRLVDDKRALMIRYAEIIYHLATAHLRAGASVLDKEIQGWFAAADELVGSVSSLPRRIPDHRACFDNGQCITRPA